MATADDHALITYYQGHGFRDGDELLSFIESFFFDKSGNPLHIPRANVCPEHTAPAEYIVDSFFEVFSDSICWASRGGGKTLLGALATWLDSIFKVGCATKILGASQEQSKRMYEHLTGEGDGWGLVTDDFRHLLRGEMLAQRTVLTNFSNIQILTASSRSVRGAHPQKLKLDEVDEMDPRIYEAALLVPHNRRGIISSVNIYSTMHRSNGLMDQIISEAPQRGFKIYHWCLLDILEKCPEWRKCEECYLEEDCEGRARNADGYYGIDLAITKKRQVSEETWQSEMLCRRPSTGGLIYKEFDLSIHVV